MSKPNSELPFCNYCEEYAACKKHYCNICETCEGVLYSFGEQFDFDLCPECLMEMQAQIKKGLVTLDQRSTDKLPEQVKVNRKTITEAERRAVFDRDGWECVKCGSPNYLQVDHIFPFARGGDTKTDNLQTLCKRCNSKKSDNI